MIEVEIRTMLKDVSEAEKKLEEKGRLKNEKIQVDEYFSHPSRDFYANPKIREYVRIRHGEKPTFEYHKAHITNGKKSHSEEFEVSIDSIKKMKEILEQLGFKPFVTVKKQRKVFDYGNFEACLDSVDGAGVFLEIESKKDFGTVEKTRQECINFLKQLGIKYVPAPEKGYPDMLAEKLTQNK
jgi:predicted adenylyl cyclase CyaB